MQHSYAAVLSIQVRCFPVGSQALFEKMLSALTDSLALKHRVRYAWVYMGVSDEVYNYDVLLGRIDYDDHSDLQALRDALEELADDLNCIGDFEEDVRAYVEGMYDDIPKHWFGTTDVGARVYESSQSS